MQITGLNTSSSFFWTLVVNKSYLVCGAWGPWALLSYADLTKHPSGPTPFPTNAPREKHIPVLVRTRAYPCTEQSRAEFSSAKFSCSEQ